MKCACWVFLLAILLPTTQCALSSNPVAAGENDLHPMQAGPANGTGMAGLQIEMVVPAFSSEIIVIENSAKGEVGLKDFSVTDQEGTLKIKEGLVLPARGRLVLASNQTVASRVLSEPLILQFPSPSIEKSGRFALADEGDELLLIGPAGEVIDVFVYGNSAYQGQGWIGKPFAKIGTGKAAIREHDAEAALIDSNGSADWALSRPGRTDFPVFGRTSMVEPYLSPQSARQSILRELHYATRSVHLAVYEITDGPVVDALADCVSRNVNVSILVEGQPVGGISAKEQTALSHLKSQGCDIHLLHSQAGYKRYDYMHAKYAIFDDRRALVQSENWNTDSMDANRGWGAVVDDRPTVGFLLGVFEADFNLGRMDTEEYKASNGPEYMSSGIVYHPAAGGEIHEAMVQTVLSPDNSLQIVLSLIANARERILIELFYADLDYCTSTRMIEELRDAAARGVQVQVLMDDNWFNSEGPKNNSAFVDHLNSFSSSNIKAKMVSNLHEFSTIHNKGMIVDDSVLISSINWGRSGFESNRELALIVTAEAIADFFALSFQRDWMEDPFPPVINVSVQGDRLVEDETVIVDARNSSDNSGKLQFLWDVDLDGVIDARGPLLVRKFSAGLHLINLTLLDKFNNSVSTRIVIQVEKARIADTSALPWMAAGAVVLAFLLILKRVKWH